MGDFIMLYGKKGAGITELKMVVGEAGPQQTERGDVPILTDARIGSSTAGLIKYRTASSVDIAVQFYQTEMPKNGWVDGEAFLIKPEMAILYYLKGVETATAIIKQDDKGITRVMISITGG
jgi:hypothetical protein